MKKYLLKKPKKWEFKDFALYGVSGLTYDLDFYEEEDLKLSFQIIHSGRRFQSAKFVWKM